MTPGSHPRRPSRRSKRVARKAWRFGGALLLTAVALVAAAFTLNRVREQREMEQMTMGARLDAAVAPADAAKPVDAKVIADRLVYPYSVIPGGINSVEELKAAIHRDPVVAAHYREFDLSRARVERLETPRLAHVSYRIGNDVYWTRKQLVLPAGERVITDGAHIARTRCGNQLATTPAATSPAEPSARVLDTPVTQKAGALASLHPAGPLGGTPAPQPPGANSGVSAGTSRPSGTPGGVLPAGAGSGASGTAAGVSGTLEPAGTTPGNGPSEPPPTPPAFVPPVDIPGLPPSLTPPGGNPFVPPGTPGNPFVPPGTPGNPFVPPGTPGNPFVPPGTPGDPSTPTGFTPPGTPGNPGHPDPHDPTGDTPSVPDNPQHPDAPTPVPEPSSVLLMLMGLGGVAGRLRRRR